MGPRLADHRATVGGGDENRRAADATRELLFDCDPALRPYDVSIRNGDLKDWEWIEAAAGYEQAVGTFPMA